MRVFLASPWVPAEWVAAHGLEVDSVYAHTRPGQLSMMAGTCAFAHAVLTLAQQESPAALVFTTHCDQMRRSFDAVHAGERMFLFNLPATWQSTVAQRMYLSELERLGRFLVSLGGVTPCAERLSATIDSFRKTRSELLRSAQTSSARQFMESTAQFCCDGAPVASHSRSTETKVGQKPVPLALVGGPMSRHQWDFLDVIEDLGGSIVLNAAEPGERNLWAGGASDHRADPASDPETLLLALARDYLDHITDAYQRPNTRLYNWLRERLGPRGVKGILLWRQVWCDMWGGEAQTMRDAFKLPVLPLDAEETAGGIPRNAGRIEAFLESLR